MNQQFLILIILFGGVFGLKLEVASTFRLQADQSGINIDLKARQSSGEIIFNVQGLPDVLYQQGNHIKGTTMGLKGSFPILIEANDHEMKVSKVIVVYIQTKKQQQSESSPQMAAKVQGKVLEAGGRQAQRRESETKIEESPIQINERAQRFTKTAEKEDNQQNNQINNMVPLSEGRSQLSIQNDPRLKLKESQQYHQRPSFTVSDLGVQSIGQSNGFTVNQQYKRPFTSQFTESRSFPSNNLQSTETTNPQFINYNFPANQYQTNLPYTSSINTLNTMTTTSPQIQNSRDITLFSHQLNTNKAISQLINIVRQLKDRAEFARRQAQQLQKHLQKTLQTQQQVLKQIHSSENTASRFKQAIRKLNTDLGIKRAQLTQLQSMILKITDQINEKDLQLALIQKQASKLNTQIHNEKLEIKELNEQGDALEKDKIIKGRDKQDLIFELKRTQNQILNVDIQIDDQVRNLMSMDEEIEDLQLQLTKAKQRRSQAQKQQQRLRKLKAQVPIIISKLQSSISTIQQQITDITNTIKNILSSIKNAERNLHSKINELEHKGDLIKEIQKQIEQLTNKKKQIDEEIIIKKQEIQDNVSNLDFLEGQLGSYEQTMQGFYRESHRVRGIVDDIRGKLLEKIRDWQEIKHELQQRLNDLEKAKAQKQSIDMAVQHFLESSKSSIYTPTIPINNINLLTTSHDINQDLINPQSLSFQQISLYQPLHQNIRVDSQNLLGNLRKNQFGGIQYSGQFECSAVSGQYLKGRIIEVGVNALRIDIDGTNFIGLISSCSKVFCRPEHQTPNVGDIVNMEATTKGNGIYLINRMYFSNSI